MKINIVEILKTKTFYGEGKTDFLQYFSNSNKQPNPKIKVIKLRNKNVS